MYGRTVDPDVEKNRWLRQLLIQLNLLQFDTTPRSHPASDDLRAFAIILKGLAMKVETSTALATFADLRVHFAKFNLVTYYDDCVQRASEVGIPEYAAVATYQGRRRHITGKESAGGGTGKEEESSIKQLAAHAQPATHYLEE